MYLKVFKTGSTTLQNIFYRQAWYNNLTIVPVYSDPYIHDLTRHLVPQRFWKEPKFNVFPEHIYYFNKEKILHYMPRDTVFIGSLRDPFSQMIAMFKEFSSLPKKINLKSKNPVTGLLNSSASKMLNPLLARPQMIYNTMSFQYDLIDAKGHERLDIVNQLAQTERSFSVIILLEHFIEGLIMLRRKLCWDHRDIVHLALRSRKPKFNTTFPRSLTEEHKRRSNTDYLLYTHFKLAIEKDFSQQNNDFWNEVNHFTSLNQNISRLCSDVYKLYKHNTSIVYSTEHNLKVLTSRWSKEFTITAYDCFLMKLDNHIFRNFLLIRQMPEICQQPMNKKKHNLKSDLKVDRKTIYSDSYYCNMNKTVDVKYFLQNHHDILAL